MRFLGYTLANEDETPTEPPSPELYEKMGAFVEEAVKAGVVVATGGIALTDDLIGQFLGQDVLRRLSRRLGEGAFNGALTARIGIAALNVIRPLPFRATAPPRPRDILAEVLRPMVGRGAP